MANIDTEVKIMDMTYEQRSEMMRKFFKKHNYDFTAHTSEMDEYSRWSKDYVFTDGAVWREDHMYVTEEVTTHIHNVEVKVKVKFLRIEFYNSDNAESNYYYEQI